MSKKITRIKTCNLKLLSMLLFEDIWVSMSIYKKDNLYSMLPKVLNCEDTYNANKQDLKPETPETTPKQLQTPG